MPDPKYAETFAYRTTRVSTGYTYRYIDESPVGKDPSTLKTVVCLHGFPDLAFGWRYQIVDFVQRGFRVIVPDQMGYGGTDKPENDVKAYTFVASAKAVHDIIAAAGVKGKPIVCGHDWGAMVAWRYLMLYPNEIDCMICLCVPPGRPSQAGDRCINLKTVVRMFPNFGYQLYFATEEAVQDLDANVYAFVSPMFSERMRLKGAEKRAHGRTFEEKAGDWALEGRLRRSIKEANGKEEKRTEDIDEPECRAYVEAFRRGGMRGPLTWYKTREANHEEDIKQGLPRTFPTHIPVLFIPATCDAALPLSLSEDSQLAKLFPGGNLEKRVVDADHWLLQDPTTRHEVTKLMGDWIESKVARHQPSSKL